MKPNKNMINAIILLVITMLVSATTWAETAFTYQGQLSQAGQPAQGQYDMTFVLYDADSGGNQVGVTLNEAGIDVTDGVFDVLLDFGDAPFNNAPRWLEIAVREAGGGVYTTLNPRQRVGASPFAIETLFVAPGAVDTAALQNGAVTEEKIADQAVTLGKIDNGAVISGSIANGEVRTVDLDSAAVTRAKIADDAIGTFQVENNTLTTNDVRNGTLMPIDAAQNHTLPAKSLYYVSMGSITNLPGQSNATSTASCADANDIPIAYFCNTLTTLNSVVLRNTSQEHWDSTSDPAQVTCSYRNNATSLGADVQSEIVCLTVD